MGFLSMTVDRGCLFLFIATVISVLCQHFRIESDDPYKCGALLTQGTWLNSLASSAAPSYTDWSPSTCMMHKYTAKTLRQCIGERKVVFIGDSQVRQIFWAMAAKLDRQQAEKEFKEADRHSDHSFKGLGNVGLEFIWDPYLNSTKLSTEMSLASSENANPNSGSNSSLIVISGGLWFAKNLNDHSLEQFNESIENLIHTLGVHERSQAEQRNYPELIPQLDHTRSLTMFVPAQRPLYESLDSDHTKTLTTDRVEPLHERLLQASSQYRIPVLWAYDAMTIQSETSQPDGLHLTENVVNALADVILNFKCNSFLTAANGYPMDKTCCSKYPKLSKTQVVFLNTTWLFPILTQLLPWTFATAAIIFKGNAGRSNRPVKQSNQSGGNVLGLLELLPPPKVLTAVAVVLLISCYCWLADRTHVFNKSQKHYTNEDFTVLCLMTLLVGILSIRRSNATNRSKPNGSDPATDDLFLSRDQTDEWKGWMQIMILIYHYTGGSKILWIYKIIRLLVAAYLFLTGYGHTIFFFKKADFSLKRVAGVLVRLNLLSCILPYVMQTDYLFYYFAPLVSFWYIVVYATMAIGKSWNRTPIHLSMKIAISALVVTNLISWQPGMFKSVFLVLRKSCDIQWDADDWQFRLGLDRYIVFVGMLVAASTMTSQEKTNVFNGDLEDIFKAITANTHGSPSRNSLHAALNRYLRDKTLAYLTTTGVGCLFYALFAYPAKDKESHNKIFSIASIGPILAFIAIRNSFPWTRRFYSSIFAWIGRHSLETFVLQFHIWLAADTKGVLSTGLFDRSQKQGKWLDFTLLTISFLWICWHAADALQIVTAYIVDPKPVQRGDHSGVDLPMTKSNGNLASKSPKEKSGTGRGDVTQYIAVRVGSVVRLPRNVIAESLWARLVLILGVFWCLNMLK